MSQHYEDLREEQAGAVAVVVPEVPEKSARELFQEILEIQAEIGGIVNGVKENPVLMKFSETAAACGPMGMAGLAMKIPELIPEVKPLFPVIGLMIKAGDKQNKLLAKLIDQVEVSGGNHG